MFDPKLEKRLEEMVTKAIWSQIPDKNFIILLRTEYHGVDREPVFADPGLGERYEIYLNTDNPLVKSLFEEMKTLLPTVTPLYDKMDKLNEEISRLKTPSERCYDGRPLEVWIDSYPRTDELKQLEVEKSKLNEEKNAIIAQFASTNAKVKKIVAIINRYNPHKVESFPCSLKNKILNWIHQIGTALSNKE